MNVNSIIQASIDFIDSKLSTLSDDCKKDFAKRLRLESQPANTTLVKEGEFSDKLFFIYAVAKLVVEVKHCEALESIISRNFQWALIRI